MSYQGGGGSGGSGERQYGRGRGRATDRSTEQRFTERGRPQETQRPPHQTPQGAWGRRAGPQTPQQGPYARPPPQTTRNPSMELQNVMKAVSCYEGSGGDASRSSSSRGHSASRSHSSSRSQSASRSQAAGGGGNGGGNGGGDNGGSSTTGRGFARGGKMVTVKTRPPERDSKKGEAGKRIMLKSNYFQLLTKIDWTLYKYSVSFAPEEDTTVIRKALVKNHVEQLGAYIFDGSVLYSVNRYPENFSLFSERKADNARIRITITRVDDMVKTDHHYIQFFNIIMRKCFGHLKLQLVGRNYFDARNKVDINEFRLQLWPGYLTSIRQHESAVLMCAEITHKVMRQETILDILMTCYNRYGERYKDAFSNGVIGCTVLTGYNNHTYRIDDVDFTVNPKSKFRLKDGTEISYQDYYKNKYDIRLRNDTQPLLVTRTKPRDRRAGQSEMVYLVPELCRSTGLTDEMRNDFNLMRALDKHTRVGPDVRIRKLMSFNARLLGERPIVNELSMWNMQLDSKLVEIPGRLLDPERLKFAKNVIKLNEKADWTNDLRNIGLVESRPLRRWILFHDMRSRNEARDLVSTLQRVSQPLFFEISHPEFVQLQNDNAATYAMELEKVLSRTQPDLVFCMVSNNRADRYAAIKKKCCCDRPVPSQVLITKNMKKKFFLSIATKIVIQMNCKLGGAPWFVDIPVDHLMVIGFDVCHDTSSKDKDFGALVASLNKSQTSYYSAINAHKNGEELSDFFSANVGKAVAKYREVNGRLPLKIIIYRDGVGEGQIPYVYEHEVGNVRSVLGKLYNCPPDEVKLAFIVVTKRINTRLFHNSSNPVPGTIVDDVITDPLKYDFFLVSQSVKEGTVSPTSYNVISDTFDTTPDRLQRLTYKFTLMYFNCSTSVRLPAVVHYAHKLAFLVSQYIHIAPNPRMEHLLYFL
ncbi:piwi-like protein Siwi [Prorops nasuta]|uniref:piwi-like protein Siwi n=1 Tax=Prorops nasuta TaxID=863751 RepID=UPI0034CE99F8